jgi:hypothetical protein
MLFAVVRGELEMAEVGGTGSVEAAAVGVVAVVDTPSLVAAAEARAASDRLQDDEVKVEHKRIKAHKKVNDYFI